MRDLMLVAFFFVAIYYTFKRPAAGVCVWIWIALAAPTEWVFGFSQIFRLNFSIVIVTALSYFSWKERSRIEITPIHFWVLFFCFWMLLSTVFNIRTDSNYAWSKYIEFIKVVTLFLFVTLTVKTKKDIDAFVWAIVIAISAYAGMEAVKFILSGGGHRIVGRAGILADRNDLAVAINMCLPLMVYLRGQTEKKWINLGILGLIILNVVAIVGTYSRGGFIGLAILGGAMWLASKRKMLFALLIIIALPVLYGMAPESWKERQTTVNTAASQDSSFIGRLWAWKIATLIAIDNPMTGGGFKATTDPVLWHLYAGETPDFGPVYTQPIPRHINPKAAHNIYFQVLASAGFAGLTIFLLMLMKAYTTCRMVLKWSANEGVVWMNSLSKAIALALIGYGITGLNVSLAYFELVYAILGVLSVLLVISKAERQSSVT